MCDPVPDSPRPGVGPQVIAELVQRRRQVKGFMASERDPVRYPILTQTKNPKSRILDAPCTLGAGAFAWPPRVLASQP